MRRKTAVAGYSYLAGVFFASFFTLKLNFLLSMVLFFIAAGAVLFSFRNKCFVLTVLISFAVGVGIYAVYEKFDYNNTIAYNGKSAHFNGEILDYDYIANDIILVTVKGTIKNKSVKLTAFVPYDDCEYYDKISFSATYKAIKNNPCFNTLDYNKAEGIYLTAQNVSEVKISDGGFSVLKYIRNYSDYLYRVIRRTIPGETGDFMGAMLCGDTSGLESRTKANLNRMGIGHIFSVSGTHLVIVSFIINYFLEMIKISKTKKFIVTEILIFAFAVFSGMSSSVLRASVMVTIINLSKLFKRKADNVTTIAICGILLTIFSPEKIRSASFLLSISGVFSLSVVSPIVIKAINYKGKLKKLVDSFISMCTIWVCSLPFSLMFFNSVSTVAPIANIIFVPLCCAALVFLVVVAFVGGISILAEPMLIVSGFLILPVLKASELVSKLRFSYISLGMTELRICSFIFIAVILIMIALKFKAHIVVKSVIACFIALCVTASAVTVKKRDVLEIYVINYENSCITVLNKNRKAVIIDKEGDISEACFRLLEYKGVVEVLGIFTYGNEEFLSAYYNANLLFCEFDCENTFPTDEVSTFDFYGSRIDFYDKSFTVTYENSVTEISYFENAEFINDSDAKIKCYKDNTEITSDNGQIIYDCQDGLILKYEMKKQGISEIRRFNYAFG